MKTTIRLSVIVPVYNVEKYLQECVDSILAQDVEDMEVILVDDGSTDGSGKLCDEYAKKDKRVMVIHKDNGGPASARNAGLDLACGKYIAFVDSDDYLLPNTYLPNLGYMEGHPEVDCLQFPFAYDQETAIVRYYKRQEEEKTFVGNEVYLNWWNGKVIYDTLWGKVFKREVFTDLRLPIGVFAEDAMIVPELSKRCHRVFLSMKGRYFYRCTEGSLMNSKFTEKKYKDFFISRLVTWERVNELDYMTPVKIKAYVKTIITLAWCSHDGGLNYNDYPQFLDSVPSFWLLAKSRQLDFKKLLAFIILKTIGSRGFIKLYCKLK